MPALAARVARAPPTARLVVLATLAAESLAVSAALRAEPLAVAAVLAVAFLAVRVALRAVSAAGIGTS
jgi:hypothetical protein